MVSHSELLHILSSPQIFTDPQCSASVFSGRDSEVKEYLDNSGNRIIATFNELYNFAGKSQKVSVLEIGAGPYFLTSLMLNFLNCDLTCVEPPAVIWPGESFNQSIKSLYFKCRHGVRKVDEVICNAEKECLPFPDKSFDIVIATEVIEHLIFSPTLFLYQIHRVLKTNGILILSTPNAASFTKLAKLIMGKSVWDHYSGYGVYGRHQREYTRRELCAFLAALNFRVERAREVYYGFLRRTLPEKIKALFFAIIPFRKPVLFFVARAHGKDKAAYPEFLFKSIYPDMWKKSGIADYAIMAKENG